MKKRLLFCLLLIISVINPLNIVSQNWERYVTPGYSDQYETLKQVYYSSQYANKNHSGFIPDELLESFAGGIFLTGINPILIHHDQPPLGRYLVALSILLFDNEKTIPFILIITSAISIYLLSLLVLKNNFLALIPFALFINQPLFTDKFLYLPLLEPTQFPFIVFALYTFIIGVQRKNYLPWFIATAILIGAVISIRYFVLGGALTTALVLFLLIKRQRKQLYVFLASLILSLFVLLASYTQTFLAGYSLIKVLGIQKYIFVYHQSAFAAPFSFWDLLLFNKWHTWWGGNAIVATHDWNISWPLAIVAIVASLIFFFRKKIALTVGELVLLLWIAVYSAMLSVGYTSTRYFLPFIPFTYILATSFLVRIIKPYLPKSVRGKKKASRMKK